MYLGTHSPSYVSFFSFFLFVFYPKLYCAADDYSNNGSGLEDCCPPTDSQQAGTGTKTNASPLSAVYVWGSNSSNQLAEGNQEKILTPKIASVFTQCHQVFWRKEDFFLCLLFFLRTQQIISIGNILANQASDPGSIPSISLYFSNQYFIFPQFPILEK